jgi:hypothetical protein
MPRVFAWLAATDEVAAATVPADLRQIIGRVEPRHFPGLNYQCFHVPVQMMWLGNV